MKKIQIILAFFIGLIFLYSCAKPTVVKVILPEDETLNCEQLKNAITESKKIRRDFSRMVAPSWNGKPRCVLRIDERKNRYIRRRSALASDEKRFYRAHRLSCAALGFF